MHPVLKLLQAVSVVFVLVASVQSNYLQLLPTGTTSIVQAPSLPINPVHPRFYEYVLQADNTFTQPFLVVIHPIKKNLQSSFVDVVVGASVHTKGLHAIYPAVQGPSLPIIPEHPAIV